MNNHVLNDSAKIQLFFEIHIEIPPKVQKAIQFGPTTMDGQRKRPSNILQKTGTNTIAYNEQYHVENKPVQKDMVCNI